MLTAVARYDVVLTQYGGCCLVTGLTKECEVVQHLILTAIVIKPLRPKLHRALHIRVRIRQFLFRLNSHLPDIEQVSECVELDMVWEFLGVLLVLVSLEVFAVRVVFGDFGVLVFVVDDELLGADLSYGCALGRMQLDVLEVAILYIVVFLNSHKRELIHLFLLYCITTL